MRHVISLGAYFLPNELHGITMQEGPDGNTDAAPTFWCGRFARRASVRACVCMRERVARGCARVRAAPDY